VTAGLFAEDRCGTCKRLWAYCTCYPRHPGSAVPAESAEQDVNPVALWDALNLAASAVLAAEGGDTAKAETALLEAQLAAGDAFPAGSREAEALGIILEAAGRVREESL
jgi:hypothetical protein